MNELNFEFEYQTPFEELDVRTERLAILITKGQVDKITVKGEIAMNKEVNYEMFDDKLINFKSSEKRMAIDTSDLEDDLEDRDVDLDKSKLVILVPDDLNIRVESEMGRISIENIKAKATISSEIGSICLDDISGSFKVDSEIGSVTLNNGDFQKFSSSTEVGNIDIIGIKADSLICETEVGQVNIKGAEVSDVTISSETGNIEYQLLPIKQNQTKIDTEIGKVKIILPEEINLELKATSEIGTVTSYLKNVTVSKIEEGVFIKNDSELEQASNVKINASTEIGSITILNEGSQADEDKEQFKQHRFNPEFSKAMNEVNRATKVLSSPAVRRSIGGAFANLGEVIKSSVQSALKEADSTVKESMRGMKADLQQQRQEFHSENVRNQREARFRNDLQKQNRGFKSEDRLSDNEKSRLKILDLLENGKITHEEAEKLLKAISK